MADVVHLEEVCTAWLCQPSPVRNGAKQLSLNHWLSLTASPAEVWSMQRGEERVLNFGSHPHISNPSSRCGGGCVTGRHVASPACIAQAGI